jgi:hypothetical protein
MVGRSRFHATLLRLPALLSILALASICARCTVAQLASGEKGIDVTKIQPGLTRSEAEAVLGPSIKKWKSPSGVTYRIYQYDSGRPPNVSDAAGAALMDIMTLGLLEVFMALQQSMGQSQILWKDYMDKQRTTGRVVISYDDQDVILGVFDEFEELPTDGRSGPKQWKR